MEKEILDKFPLIKILLSIPKLNTRIECFDNEGKNVGRAINGYTGFLKEQQFKHRK